MHYPWLGDDLVLLVAGAREVSPPAREGSQCGESTGYLVIGIIAGDAVEVEVDLEDD